MVNEKTLGMKKMDSVRPHTDLINLLCSVITERVPVVMDSIESGRGGSLGSSSEATAGPVVCAVRWQVNEKLLEIPLGYRSLNIIEATAKKLSSFKSR